MNVFHTQTNLDLADPQRTVRFSSEYDFAPSAPSASPKQIRVLVAGDHACLRSSLKTMLELDPQIKVVGEAADDCEAVKMARRLHPDVLLIDLDMHCCDNFDAVCEITQRNLTSSVVALTIHDDEKERTAAQQAGVAIFLEKGVPYRQLISAIRKASSTSPVPANSQASSATTNR